MMNLPETGFVTLVVNVPIKSELMGGGACPTRDTMDDSYLADMGSDNYVIEVVTVIN